MMTEKELMTVITTILMSMSDLTASICENDLGKKIPHRLGQEDAATMALQIIEMCNMVYVTTKLGNYVEEE